MEKSGEALEKELRKVPKLEIFNMPITYNEKDSTYNLSFYIRNKGEKTARGFTVILVTIPKVNPLSFEGVWVIDSLEVNGSQFIGYSYTDGEKPVWPDSINNINVKPLKFKLVNQDTRQLIISWQVSHDFGRNEGTYKVDIPTN